jgi:hypothetical protein
VQLTPGGSDAVSIQFGIGITDAVPGSLRGTYLADRASFADFSDPDGNLWTLQEE